MVTIDIAICSDAEGCKKCLSTCPHGVLMMVPVGRKKSSKYKPNQYCIKPYFIELCNTCMRCEEVCPENAIKIKPSP